MVVVVVVCGGESRSGLGRFAKSRREEVGEGDDRGARCHSQDQWEPLRAQHAENKRLVPVSVPRALWRSSVGGYDMRLVRAPSL